MTDELTITLAQINPTVGDIAGNAAMVYRHWSKCRSDLIVFPECVLSGYPADDLILKPDFLARIRKAFDTLVKDSIHFNAGAFVTLPWEKNGRIYNAGFLVEKGNVIGHVFKHNLPHYGIFDDKRVFSPGPLPEPITWRGQKIGFMICEDVWFPEPAEHLKQSGADRLIVSNASPFEVNKHTRRIDIVRQRVKETGLSVAYVNQTGGQDDLVFDGGSFFMNSDGKVEYQHPFFDECLTGVQESPQDNISLIYKAITLGLQDYIRKNNFKSILIGMSGGIDSAISAAIAADAIGPENVRCVMMPSPFTSKDSFEDAEECAKSLGVSYEVILIEEPLKAFEKTLPLSGLSHENIQSRIRGNILMALSNASGAMVLSTGNKSEIAAGYATLYGDMCGGYNAIKDIYKTQVYELARWRNKQGRVIPDRILTKAPTAELKPGQTDQDTLPPYDVLDAILYGLIEEDLGVDAVAAKGHDRALVTRILTLLDRAEYKRRQAAPGPKITPKAFGRDRRYPITSGFARNIEKA